MPLSDTVKEQTRAALKNLGYTVTDGPTAHSLVAQQTGTPSKVQIDFKDV